MASLKRQNEKRSLRSQLWLAPMLDFPSLTLGLFLWEISWYRNFFCLSMANPSQSFILCPVFFLNQTKAYIN
ncbi:hypothetical protein HMPREF1992_02308 [Selenomonas sp. oral taxon 892 str. F0426]|nr:hypothetical protein HMPREF1992_02308 [Selenomonas sp. oral taxon 892 str. F0426]